MNRIVHALLLLLALSSLSLRHSIPLAYGLAVAETGGADAASASFTDLRVVTVDSMREVRYTYNAMNRLESYEGAETGSFTYDDLGRVTQQTVDGDVTGFEYDDLDRVTEMMVKPAAGGYSRHVYRYHGASWMRTRATMSGVDAAGGYLGTSTAFTYDGFNVATQTTGGVTTHYATPGGSTLWSTTGGAIRTFLTDGQGALTGVYDGATASQRTAFDGFGDAKAGPDLFAGETGLNPHGHYSVPGYRGQLHDPTGQIYLRHRYYSPEIGRFLSADPIGLAAGLNMYNYAASDPVGRWDPSGLDWEWVTRGSKKEDEEERLKEEHLERSRFHARLGFSNGMRAYDEAPLRYMDALDQSRMNFNATEERKRMQNPANGMMCYTPDGWAYGYWRHIPGTPTTYSPGRRGSAGEIWRSEAGVGTYATAAGKEYVHQLASTTCPPYMTYNSIQFCRGLYSDFWGTSARATPFYGTYLHYCDTSKGLENHTLSVDQLATARIQFGERVAGDALIVYGAGKGTYHGLKNTKITWGERPLSTVLLLDGPIPPGQAAAVPRPTVLPYPTSVSVPVKLPPTGLIGISALAMAAGGGPAPKVETPTLSGTGRAPTKGTPNSIYEQLDDAGNVRSRTWFDENGRSFNRQDFDHPHAGMQPHEHSRTFSPDGKPLTKGLLHRIYGFLENQ